MYRPQTYGCTYRPIASGLGGVCCVNDGQCKMHSMTNQSPILDYLRSLKLPANDFAIFGSGPMYAYGLKDLDNDLDIIARGKAWEKALELGAVDQNAFHGLGKVELADGKIEITNYWFDDLQPGVWDVDELIDNAVIIDGLKYVTLENVLKWKKLFGRPKDLAHAKIIEDFLAGQR